jgi:hypothetical protein
MSRHHASAALWLLTLGAILSACGGGSSDKGLVGRIVERAVGTAKADAAAGMAIRTATLPADECGWLTVEEVEAVVGKLAEPPRLEDGCRYTVVLPEGVKAERQRAITEQDKLEAQLKAAYKDYEPARFNGPIADYERNPKTYAMSLSVRVGVSGAMIGEVTAADAAASGKTIAAGWEAEFPLIVYGFGGRVGNAHVVVQTHAPDVPDALARTLAERVRDRIPDLPPAVTNPYQSYELGSDRSPCSLLTRAEAEAVLGPLLVDPYPSSTDAPGLAHPRGHACAYYTAGHHAFVVSPNWMNGTQVFKLDKGIGGLMSIITPPDAAAMKGPWDESHASVSGALMFLKGDDLLTVHYTTSSTDRRGALALAAQAIQRM